MSLTRALDAALAALDHDPLALHREAQREAPTGTDDPPARRLYAAAHLVMADSYAGVEGPDQVTDHIDWEATFGLRRHLDQQGLGIAEAMDTAQRFELGWDVARRLIEGTGALGLGAGFVAGASVDHLPPGASPQQLIDGVVHQARLIQEAGGVVILLPLVALPERGAGAQDYIEHYTRVIDALDGPLLVHWLGAMFHPGLAGYFPGDSFARIMAHAPDKVRGCKLSLLDADQERRVRAELAPREQVVFTGDDHHFADLIVEDGAAPTGASQLDGQPLALGAFSHALLGVFDGIAIPAGLCLKALAAGEGERARALLAPCEEYGRHVFAAPTAHYKAGLAFTSYLAGHQSNPMLPLHLERARDAAHYLRAAELAALAGAFDDRGLAQARLRQWMTTVS